VVNTQGDGAGVDIGIEFALAVVDPIGNPTNGIIRYNMAECSSADCVAYMDNGVNSATALGMSDLALKTLSHWDSNTYYNFWLVSEIDNNNGGAGIQGFATFPGFHGNVIDGTIVMANTFRNLNMTVESHELGHAFNLQHTFKGETISGSAHICPPTDPSQGDFCADTAPHTSDIIDCYATGTNSCDTGAGGTGDYSRFINNYMSYSYDSCRNMFTPNQKDRILAALTGSRQSFLSVETANHLVPVAATVCDFSPSQQKLIMTGEDVSFADVSMNIPNTYIDNANGISASWSVSNGTNTLVSSNQNPKFVFSVPGNYGVSLTSTNAIGSDSKSIPNTVLVTDPVVVSSTPTTTNASNFGSTIYEVTFKGISNQTSFVSNQFLQDGVTKQSDFTSSKKTAVSPGETVQLSVGLNSTSTVAEYFAAYIDYNNDGVYTVDEKVAEGNMPATTNTCAVLADCSINSAVTIPASATKNKLLRMRIIGSRSAVTLANMNGTATMSVGDIEDYGIYIVRNDLMPSISYNSPSNFTVGTAIASLNPTSTGGTAISYTVSPSLPMGLNMNTATGVISGTPNVASVAATYMVTAANGGGTSTYGVVISVSQSLSTEDSTFSEVRIFPNPVKDILTIEGENNIERVEVVNLLGQLVYSEEFNVPNFNIVSKNKFIDLSKLKAGTYVIVFISSDKRSSYKIIKN
jgi:hypothetical protein